MFIRTLSYTIILEIISLHLSIMTPDHSAHECPIIPEYIFPLNCNYYSKSDYAVLLGSSLLTLTYVVINIAIMKHGKIHSLYYVNSSTI